MNNQSKYILGLVLILTSSIGFAQTNDNYVLVNKSDYSDINYDLFECFIQFLDCKNYDEKYTTIEDIFIPKKGEYSIYNFIKTYEGLSYTGETKTFHDLLILKIDTKTNKIIDGYQYTKEWAELPLAYDLYRLTNKKVTLNNTINIQDLDFKQMDYLTISNEKLDDDNTIIFK